LLHQEMVLAKALQRQATTDRITHYAREDVRKVTARLLRRTPQPMEGATIMTFSFRLGFNFLKIYLNFIKFVIYNKI
jgi:hypothetical protein